MLNKIYLFIIFLFIIVPACGKNQSVDDLLEKGEILISRVKPEEAIKCFNKAIELEPDSMKAWFYKAIAFNSVPDYKKMKECLNIAINKDLIITKKTLMKNFLTDGMPFLLQYIVIISRL